MEQLNRRTTGLAAYRLYKDRMIKAGARPGSFNNFNGQEFLKAVSDSRKAINYTQVDPSSYNTPRLFRGTMAEHIFLYKMFLVNTLQLIRHLDTANKVKLLALVWVMAGLKGIPFAEDLMDIFDTLLQAAGIRSPGVELVLTQAIEDIMPGASPFIMRGILDSVFGGTFSTRTGLGDIIPGTGAFRVGADPGREIMDAAGPVVGAVAGLGGFIATSADYAAQVVGLKPSTTTLADVVRALPVAGLRAPGEAIIWGTEGDITNQRGQLVAEDISPWVLMMRTLGFYPTEVTQYNDIIRMGRYADNYVKHIRKKFVDSYAEAKRKGDRERMSLIRNQVRDWNNQTRGTEFEIRNFLISANRAASEANRDAIDRYIRTTSLSSRDTIEELAKVYGYE
jgi:hypothetical protein